MTTRHFATVSIRVLGVATVVVGVVFGGTSAITRALSAASVTGITTTDSKLHDTYYVISHIEDAGLVPGTVSLVVGVLLLVTSRSLGALLARGTEMDG